MASQYHLDDIHTEQIKHFGTIPEMRVLIFFLNCLDYLKMLKIQRNPCVVAVLKAEKESKIQTHLTTL